MQVRMKQWLLLLFAALLCGWLSVPALAADAGSAQEQAARQPAQPGNKAPVWRGVRGGDKANQTTQVRGVDSAVLIQPQGETWRQVRNDLVTVYGGWLIVVVMIAIGVFYWIKGAL